jgi:hypothetical protein
MHHEGRLTTRARRRAGFLFLILGGLLATVTGPASSAVVDFTPDPGFVCDTLDVDVNIDASVTDLRGFTFVFEFDPSVVLPIAASAGALESGAACGNFFTWVNAAAIGDSIHVDGATLGCSVAGPGSIVQLRFITVTHGATSPLTCRSGSMRNALNQEIPYTCSPGALDTCPGIGVEARPWTSVTRLYR